MKLSIVNNLPDTLRTNSVVLNINQGQRLFRKGDRAEYIYFIKSGRFQEISYPEIGKLSVLQILSDGEVLGESSLHTRVYHSTVIAQTDAQVIAYPNYILLETLRNSPLLIDTAVEMLTQKINELQIRLEWRNISIADQRVWAYLKHKMKQVSEVSDESFNSHQTQNNAHQDRNCESNQKHNSQCLILETPLQEIAAELGFVPGTLSRALAKLEAERKITRDKNRITLNDVA